MKKRLLHIPRKLTILIFTLVTALTPALYFLPTHATEDSVWIGKGEPSFYIEGNYNHNTNHTISGKTCSFSTHKVIMKNAAIVEKELCLIATPFGEFDRSGRYYIPKNNTKALEIDNEEDVIPLSNSSVILTLGGEGHPRQINFYKDPIRFLFDRHRDVNPSPDYSLSDSNGNPILISSSYMGFSSNGQWMFAKTSKDEVIRVNLNTYEMTTVADDATIGPSSGTFAITNDGRYGFYGRALEPDTGLEQHNWIIDFANCEGSSYPEVDQNCERIDLNEDLIQFGGIRAAASLLYPSFNSDGTQLSATMSIEGETGTKNVTVTAPNNQYSGLDYLALGDSFASGEGDSKGDTYYEPGTNISESPQLPRGEKCHLSRRSYPYLIAQQMEISNTRFKSVACSGAVINDIRLKTGVSEYLGQDNRLSGVGDEIHDYRKEAREDFIPGRIRQIDFVDKYKPKAVTISIGGNDAYFADVIRACVVPVPLPGSTCNYAADDVTIRQAKAEEVRSLAAKLQATYNEIHTVSPHTKIYVLGYSKIINSTSSCSYFNFDASERVFLNEAFAYMNEIIEAATKNSGVKYIDVENALNDAVICGNESPRAVNGVKFGDDQGIGNIKVIGNESFHPNEHGHAKIAQSIIQQTQPGLKQHQYCDMPEIFVCPSETPIPQLPTYFTSSQPTHSRPINHQITDETIQRLGQEIPIDEDYLFNTNSQVTISAQSDPITLARVTADEYGSINTTVTIPHDLPVGYHTLHLTGTSLSGEQVDYYQSILVLGQDGDVDNNSTPDNLQDCIEAPVAVTHEGSDIFPCEMEIDSSTVPEEPGNPPENDLEQTISGFLKNLWQRITESPIFQRLSTSQQERLERLYQREIAPSLKQSLLHCSQEQTTTLQLGIFNLTLKCQPSENRFLVTIHLRIFNIVLFMTQSVL